MLRMPAVAGQFYAGTTDGLKREMASLINEASVRTKVKGVVAPHAGYLYSGAVAGQLYGQVIIPETVIILGPNHHGIGALAALSPADAWLSPLGAANIEQRLAMLVRQHAPMIELDPVSHKYEHSIEVQLPFLQTVKPDVAIVPICLGFDDMDSCRKLGIALAAAIKEFGEDVLIVASSDMTHYESARAAKDKDELALAKLLSLDPSGLLNTCRRNGITMCGVIPTAVMLVAVTEMGAVNAELVCYATSGDINGDNRSVVAYAAVTVS